MPITVLSPLLVSFLITPVLLALLPVVIPLIGKLVVDLFAKKVPRRVKPLAALGVGLAAGVAGHYLGVGDTNAQLIAALGGPGAIAAHELIESATGARQKKIPQVGTDRK